MAGTITFFVGIYFAFKFAPPAAAVFGARDVYIFWGWDRINSGLAECATTAFPPTCLFDLARLTASVPGLLVRLAICCSGSVLAVVCFRLLRGRGEDEPQEIE
ncbi:hypothetical protein [Devosia alba]|uniref:hypothetical protein n=1 Tax=Devosia alba TaxID=3152360 RepID=UPI003262DDF5